VKWSWPNPALCAPGSAARAAGLTLWRLIERVIEFGIHGGGPLQGALPVADEHLLAAGGDREEAIRGWWPRTCGWPRSPVS
jgi:hypothetical protein